MSRKTTAIVTGASSGIGAATARSLAAAGFRVVVGARRLDRLEALAGEIGGTAHRLDVTDPESVEFLCRTQPEVGLLVNNAGGAWGLEPVAEALDERWEWMYKTNVLGTLRMTRALLPKLVASGNGQVINIGSTAGIEVYPGGAGYTAAKHALRALTGTLRLELLGQPVRVTAVNPGLVETEFSQVRFDGDEARAAAVYQGMTPLLAEDIADCVTWAATRPPHVNIDEIVVRPRDQATSTRVHRRSTAEDSR
ncbi:MAG: SDR family NAD(P)-dependent oxidoreductase [Acidobacteriota bacterium]